MVTRRRIVSNFYVYGNTTVRTPLRFQKGLQVLKNEGFNGNLDSRQQEEAFKIALNEAGVIQQQEDGKDTSSVARKWRSALDKTGFITPKKKGLVDAVIRKYPNMKIGKNPYELTDQGRRLINAKTVSDIQDTLLRAMLAVQIPSDDCPGEIFKPFPFTIKVMDYLFKFGESKGLNRTELLIVGSVSNFNKVQETAEQIISFRRERDKRKGKREKTKFDRAYLEPYVNKFGVKYDTFATYADPNFKYMLATGLFSRQERRLKFNDNKIVTIKKIIENEPNIYNDEVDYYYHLWKGYELPDDNKETILEEINRLAVKLNHKVSDDKRSLSPADLKQLMHTMQAEDSNNQEEIFARNQNTDENIVEIIDYLRVINGEVKNGEEYENARDDMPTYLEWSTWRAFLAIDGLKNRPDEARGFNVDQDFYPVNTAPGGRPDIVLEFQNYVLVVEVTLTSSSRQEAAEAEPVRRHVVQIQEKYQDKPVYGLFIAKTLDNNTAEMFRTGLWYQRDQPYFVNIVPITISQFITIMEEFLKDRFSNYQIERLIEKCLIPRNATVLLWKQEIDKTIKNYQLV